MHAYALVSFTPLTTKTRTHIYIYIVVHTHPGVPVNPTQLLCEDLAKNASLPATCAVEVLSAQTLCVAAQDVVSSVCVCVCVRVCVCVWGGVRCWH